MSTVAAFVDELSDVIAAVGADCSDNIIVCGDLNCPGVDSTHVDDELAAALDSFGLFQLIRSPTRSDNVLDVLASVNPTAVFGAQVSDACYISDHRLITANIIVRSERPKTRYTARNVKTIDPSKFQEALESSELFTQPAATVDDFADQLKTVVMQVLDRMAPLHTGVRRPAKPATRWLSNEAIDAKRLRRRLERRWLTTKDEVDRINYRRVCRSTNKIINKSRSSYYNTMLQDCCDEPAKRWGIIKELLHSTDSDNTRTDDECRELCNTFSSFFVSKIASLKLAINDKITRLSSTLCFPDPPHSGPLFDSLPLVTPDEVLRILQTCPKKSSPMDYIPTSLLLACKPVFSHLICRLANLSFSEGRFPSSFKFASITPLLKKPNLDKSLPANYRPISNLNTISKILERLFLARFQPFVSSSPNFNQFQSAYRRHHSTETAILSTLDNIFHSSDNGKSTLLVSLDLSAAFDTIDHRILINRLETCFGVSATVLSWLSSYLIGRQQSVRVGGHSSPFLVCKSGVPQGSVLGPILFNMYTSPLSIICSSHGISQQQYADDTQLFIALAPSSISVEISKLTLCLTSLHSWFSQNGLALNADKSESILLGTRQRSHSYRDVTDVTSVNVADAIVPLTDHVKLLGVTLDSHLTFDKHVNVLTKTCFYHIRAFRHIRPAITEDMVKLVAC